MSRDLAVEHWLSTNEPSSIDPKYVGTVLEPAVEPAKEEAQLIMARLMRAYLERRHIGS